MKTTQKFVYIINEIEKGWLLMPNEVEQIKNYLELFPEKSMKDAFEWFTGKVDENINNVKLVVSYF
jgi:hypothetical protein